MEEKKPRLRPQDGRASVSSDVAQVVFLASCRAAFVFKSMIQRRSRAFSNSFRVNSQRHDVKRGDDLVNGALGKVLASSV